jgi:hypothetical protein
MFFMVYLSLVTAANWWVDGSGTLGGSARNQRVLQPQYSKTYYGIIKRISDFPDIGLDFGTGPGEE